MLYRAIMASYKLYSEKRREVNNRSYSLVSTLPMFQSSPSPAFVKYLLLPATTFLPQGLKDAFYTSKLCSANNIKNSLSSLRQIFKYVLICKYIRNNWNYLKEFIDCLKQKISIFVNTKFKQSTQCIPIMN